MFAKLEKGTCPTSLEGSGVDGSVIGDEICGKAFDKMIRKQNEAGERWQRG